MHMLTVNGHDDQLCRHTIMCTRAVIWICGTIQYVTGCDIGAFPYYTVAGTLQEPLQMRTESDT